MKRFPVGLTLATALAFSLLIGLGVWQLRRLAWKEDLLAKVAALRAAPARPAAEVLARAAGGADEEYRRVSADCGTGAGPQRIAYRYALRDGQVGWRLLTFCRLGGGPFDAVLLDRGLVDRFTGAMSPAPAVFSTPVSVVGVLRAAGGKPWLGPAEMQTIGGVGVFRVLDRDALESLARENAVRSPAPYLLAVEREWPAPAGVTPAALPQDIPNNHFVYALTWFALAGVLVWVYGALLFRRLQER